MAYSSRDLARAASIYERMLRDQECGVILCLAGSLISAGLKQIFVDMVRSNMVDAIVSTGANIVDQDFFEALGYKHWIADDLSARAEDATLRELKIDRIYDTLIDEEELRRATNLPHHCRRPGAAPLQLARIHPRDGRYLEKQGKTAEKEASTASSSPPTRGRADLLPAFTDCSAGFGLVAHQQRRGDKPKVSIDAVKDFRELTH